MVLIIGPLARPGAEQRFYDPLHSQQCRRLAFSDHSRRTPDQYCRLVAIGNGDDAMKRLTAAKRLALYVKVQPSLWQPRDER